MLSSINGAGVEMVVLDGAGGKRVVLDGAGV